MAEHGEVKFKVRRNALMLQEFTIDNLVRATGLKPESVRTEVQRMKQEGLLTSESKQGQRGASYQLSDDPEKRLSLSRSVEAFYPEPSEPVGLHPTSRLYEDALKTLEQAEDSRGEKRKQLLTEAKHQLEGAWQAEGADRAPGPVKAHLLRERGRLAYLQGKLESANEILKQTKEIFLDAGLKSESNVVEEYLVTIEAWRRIQTSNAFDDAARARCVIEALTANDSLTTSPLVELLADLTRELSRTVRDRVAKEAMQAETHRKVVETSEETKSMHKTLLRLEREGIKFSFQPEPHRTPEDFSMLAQPRNALES